MSVAPLSPSPIRLVTRNKAAAARNNQKKASRRLLRLHLHLREAVQARRSSITATNAVAKKLWHRQINCSLLLEVLSCGTNVSKYFGNSVKQVNLFRGWRKK